MKCFMNDVISAKVGELAFSQHTDILSFIPQGVSFCGGNIFIHNGRKNQRTNVKVRLHVAISQCVLAAY